MPFDDEDDIKEQNIGLKKVSNKPSIFDNKPKKPSQRDFEQQVEKVNEVQDNYKLKMAEALSNLKQVLNDKTLSQNKSAIAKSIEIDALAKLIALASEINNDPNQDEGIGSLGIIAFLIKHSFNQRDRINSLEFELLQAKEKIKDESLNTLISRQIKSYLENKDGNK